MQAPLGTGSDLEGSARGTGIGGIVAGKGIIVTGDITAAKWIAGLDALTGKILRTISCSPGKA